MRKLAITIGTACVLTAVTPASAQVYYDDGYQAYNYRPYWAGPGYYYRPRAEYYYYSDRPRQYRRNYQRNWWGGG